MPSSEGRSVDHGERSGDEESDLRFAEDVRSERGSRTCCKSLTDRKSKWSYQLILQVNATPEDEAGIGDELGIMGVRDPGFRVLTYEMSIQQR